MTAHPAPHHDGTAGSTGSALGVERSRLATILEALDDFVYLVDRDWRFTHASRSALALWGMSIDEVVGRPYVEVLPQEAGSESLRMQLQAATDGKVVEAEVMSPTLGRPVWLRVHPVPGDGTLVYFRDLSERRATAALRESEERHRLIVEGARDYAIITTDPHGRVESWSPGAAHVFGWPADEIVGEEIALTFVPEDRAAGADVAEREVARTAGVAPDVRWHQRRDGGRVFIEGSMWALHDGGGELRGFLKVGQDVTERLRTERALRDAEEEVQSGLESRITERTAELARANEALAAHIAERMRLETARDDLRRQLAAAEEDERRRIARELHDQLGQHLTALTLGLADARRLAEGEPEAVLRLARLQGLATSLAHDAHHLALELRPPELDELGVDSALASYAEQWSLRYGIPVAVEVTGSRVHPLPPDTATAVYRVAQEALTNVARHAVAGHVSIILELGDEVAVRLIVEDDGRGFDVDATRDRARADRRIGLAGMHERAALAGGSMAVESTPGAGTTIYLRLPAPPAEAAS